MIKHKHKIVILLQHLIRLFYLKTFSSLLFKNYNGKMKRKKKLFKDIKNPLKSNYIYDEDALVHLHMFNIQDCNVLSFTRK